MTSYEQKKSITKAPRWNKKYKGIPQGRRKQEPAIGTAGKKTKDYLLDKIYKMFRIQ